MANEYQNENALPIPGSDKRTVSDLLPRFFRTEANRKFLQATLDQLVQPGVAEKLSGYIGRKNAKAFNAADNYIGDVTKSRTSYQFEPATVIKDELDNVTFYKDYNDYISQLKIFGANVDNLSRLNSQETYAWNPNIDWDKFTNFREYYWLPSGPKPVRVAGQSKEVVSTYTVTLVDNGDNTTYLFTPDGFTANPTLKLYRGQTYRFEINCPGHPMAFSISRTFTPGNAVVVAGREGIRGEGLFDAQLYGNDYDLGEYIILPSSGSVTFEDDANVSTLFPDGIRKLGEEGEEIANVYIEKGTIEFTIPENAPDRLYYISKNNIDTSGLVRIYDIEENTELDVAAEIVGKKTYTSANGVEFTNGLKIEFIGDVTPTNYAEGFFYIEGVGEEIQLVPAKNLDLSAPYAQVQPVAYDSDQFDTLPFQSADAYAANKDYITINRSSPDKNSWSRYNKWFHKDVLVKSAEYNNSPLDIDENARAKRPIIEFVSGLKLYNFGTSAKNDVSVVDTTTTDVFSTIEGSLGYNIDGVDLAEGMRVLFLADPDPLVSGKIFRVTYITKGATRQISLVETFDSNPKELETVVASNGQTLRGRAFYYERGAWQLAQQKYTVNQEPLFDLCCPQGNAYSNLDIFGESSFRGTKVFSYALGTGENDSELGFPLKYKNIENSGDILFNFDLLNDTIKYINNNEVVSVNASVGNLRKYRTRTNFKWVNGWASTPIISKQKVLRQYVVTAGLNNNFEIDVYNTPALLTDLRVNVFVNNKIKKEEVDYTLDRINKRILIRFFNNLALNDVVLIKTHSSEPKNDNGWYDFPINFERNPLNEEIGNFTLGEVIDHVDSMIEDLQLFEGAFPGPSNLRDLGNVNSYGKRFVKHSGPINLPLYHITDKNYNIVKAIQHSSNEYARFKRIFVETATNLGYDGPVREHVNKVLKEINSDKVKTQPFCYSDMLETGTTSTVLEYEILDPRNPYYPITKAFNLDSLSQRAITVYLNGEQLIYGRDYTFSETYLLLVSRQQEGDILQIYESTSTDGSYIPPTPTKLGLYPKFHPVIEFDDTVIATEPTSNGPFKIYGAEETTEKLGWFYPIYTSRRAAQNADSSNSAEQISFPGLNRILYIPTNTRTVAGYDNIDYEEYPVGVAFIKGHDGSLVKVFKDYRDSLILELERRIFNNIKVSYDDSQLDIHSFVPGKFRKTGFTKQEIDATLRSRFVMWSQFVELEFSEHNFHDRNNQFTFNYSEMTSPVDNAKLPGFWRAVYKELYDTDRPHSHPWEMLGFTIKPVWWNEVYGPAPYTNNNLVLWSDLENGYIREPNKQLKIKDKFVRPGLINFIPADEHGRLRSPIASGAAENFFFRYTPQSWKFGDEAPVETAWRRSSDYPFALLEAWLVNQPAHVMGIGFDISRTFKNLAGQYVYGPTLKAITLKDLELPNTYADTTRIQTSGLVNYIYNLVAGNILTVYDDYKYNLSSLTNQLGFKLGGFTDKEKLKLVLESRTPKATESDGVFVPNENYKIFLNVSSPIEQLNYSAIIVEKVPSGFVIRGYNSTRPYFEYFPYVETNNDPVVNIGGIEEVSVEWAEGRDYIKGQLIVHNYKYYRATANFTSGSSFITDNLAVLPEAPVVGGKRAVFRRNFNKKKLLSIGYGTKLSNSQEVVDFILGHNAYMKSIGFSFEYFNPQTEFVENWDHAAREFLFWTTQGWAAGTTIAVSPGATQFTLESKYSVVDDIFDDFYSYSLIKQDGLPLPKTFISVYRNLNTFEIKTKNTTDGIYSVALPIVQKEHVVLLDNTTVFNDVIYEPSTGYRKERIKVIGYRSDNWHGGLDIPGFIFDQAEVTPWKSWVDYNIGSLVKYKEFYYVALYPTPGSDDFNNSFWYRLAEKPETKLYTNFDYKINQFADFYDLDSGNFDAEQQRLAQHLIGYQKREYLSNIITDDISQYKFYQGFIQDKGTKNALTKLFNPLSTSQKNSFEFYEEWAVQVGRYGAVDNVKQVEYVLDETKIKESPQSIELVETLPTDKFDDIYRIRPFEVYDKPEGYNHAPFPVATVDPNYLMSSGYVHEDDVEYKTGKTEDLETADINQLSIGQYIWITRTSNDGWNVYQLDDTIAHVVAVANTETFTDRNKPIFELTLDRWSKNILNAGDLISVKGAANFSLAGIYSVDSVSGLAVNISAPIDNEIQIFDTQNFPLVKLRPVRVETLNGLNSLIQERVYKDQKVWVDNYKDGNWAVYKNNPVYNEQQALLNPAEFDSSEHNYGRSMTVTDNNNTLFVSAPNYGNGSVYHYRRTRDVNNLIQDPDIILPDHLMDVTESRFGDSISVSPDGEYLAVGIPHASSVKTKFTGNFDSSITYNKNDIIRYRESLWKANRQILPTTLSQPFTTFDSYINLVNNTDADSTSVKLLVSGNPGLENSISSHFLVRAPLDMYLGTLAGDRVKLAWNVRSFAYPTANQNPSATELENIYPWNGMHSEVTDYINNTHVIDAKIDHILFVDTFVGLPVVGDRVTTDTGSGIVHYVDIKDDSAVIYIKETNGIIDITGELYINDIDFIGSYTEENTYTTADNLGGFWMFNLPFSYNNHMEWYDIGRGLVYVDVLLASESRNESNYYNIQTTIAQIGPYVYKRNNASFIGALSYHGDPGGIEGDYYSTKWVVRGAKSYTDIIGALPNNGFGYQTEFRVYDSDNRTVDLATAGLSYSITNKNQTVVDLWDGYIDFEYTRFDFQGNVFEPVIGDILQDVQTPFDEFGGLALTSYSTSTAEVVFYQRNFNFVRVYVKNKTGNWTKLNNIGRIEVRRKANTQARGASDVDRVIGTINDFNNDVALGTSLIGKLIVFENIDVLPIVENPYIYDEEYYFFTERTTGGAARDENPPNKLNKDYTQIYRIPVDEYGEPGPANAGAVALYEKYGNGSYRLHNVIYSELFEENRRFGKLVKLLKHNGQYILLASSIGDSTLENYGSIEIFRHGYKDSEIFAGTWNQVNDYLRDNVVVYRNNYYKAMKDISNGTTSIYDTTAWNNISWRQGKDENFRGALDTTYPYAKNSVVSYNGSLFRAKTNIAAGASLTLSNWELVTGNLDYLGILPNRTGNAFYSEDIYQPSTDFIEQFATDFEVSSNGAVLAVMSKQIGSDSAVNVKLLVYRLIGEKYNLDQVIDLDKNAAKLSLAPLGNIIAVSVPENDSKKRDQGKVDVYRFTNGLFTLTQTLTPPQNEESEKFGTSMSFSNDNLVVTSLNGDMKLPTTFDVNNKNETTFDNGFTSFRNIIRDTGVVYIFEDIEDSLVFAESFRYDNKVVSFGEFLLAKGNHVYVGMPRVGTDMFKGTVLEYRKSKNSFAWQRIRELVPAADLSKIKGAFLYNKRTNQIITYLDYIDPIQGKVAGPAEQELTHKVPFDPATYNVGVFTGVDTDVFWADEHVGELWWNIKTARFTYPYQGDIKYQRANWNELQPGASIDVYEWVASDVLPSQWDLLADTTDGVQRGISGTSVYNDSLYSQKFLYNEETKTFANKYYFWVERKLTVPNVENRKLSAFDVARLIAQPRQQGYRFISFLSKDRFLLNNCESLIYNTDVVLNIKYSTFDDKERNAHSAYQILSEGLESSVIHPDIERKWWDSLVGYDEQGRTVPGEHLTVKQKYGVQNRPRQSMFVNRTEALKQYVERVNRVCKDNILVDSYDLTLLNDKEPLPYEASGLYDVTVDTFDELKFVSTNKIEQAALTPIVQNGKIVRVDIDNPGRGYKIAPSYTLVGAGTDAEFKLTINNIGQVTDVKVLSTGSGYGSNTKIFVRRYSTLVTSDISINGKWSIYSWNNTSKLWERTSVQDYNVSAYWNYLDWYATGYNSLTPITFEVEQTSDVPALPINVGDIVKINSVGSGGWLLLEKIANESTEDFTVNFKTIGRENGTIEFKDTLYNYEKSYVGFDNRTFDVSSYDNNPITELRIILNLVKNKLFVGELKVEYNKLFFASLRYVLHEQNYVDWMFKTSFIKIKHNVGTLEQDITFNTDTLPSYKSYVEEVKPYKSVIREFVSAYDTVDNTNSVISDFDVPPYYNTLKKEITPVEAVLIGNNIVSDDNVLQQYPRKNWLDNHGYEVVDIQVKDGGSGFTTKPIVKITGGGGSGATAEAYLGYGKITRIKVTNTGSGYIKSPTITIEGSQVNGSPAKVSAVLGNGVVRTPTIKIKFDRVSGTYFISTLLTTEIFTGTALTTTFNLEWPIDTIPSKIKVFINNVEQLRSTYTYKNISNMTVGYQRLQGQLKFNNPPANGSVIKIEYYKPLSMLTAADRIKLSEIDNMLGKTLAYLMDGIDYGGVEVTSFDFGTEAGWDTKGWYVDTWDVFDNTYEDEVFTFDQSTLAVELSAPLETGMIYNLYLKRAGTTTPIRIDDPNFGNNNQGNPNALMPSILGDGVTTVINLGDYDFFANDGDVLIVRKHTSDGSFIPDPESYDTELIGGDLPYATAKGIRAEEIIVDGDGFVTPTTSKGPEELVPGQVLDSLDIKVYTRDTIGQGLITCQNYIMNSAVDTYSLGVVPGTTASVFVKLDNILLADDEYTIDWDELTVTIHNPVEGVELNIIAVERGGQGILDYGKIVIDNSVEEVVIPRTYIAGETLFVTVNGVRNEVTSVADETTGHHLITFDRYLEVGDVVHWTVFRYDGNEINYSQITKDAFTGDGNTTAFVLSEVPFYAEPTAYNVLVKVGNRILYPGYNIQYTIPENRQREFTLESFQQPGNALTTEDVNVYINGEKIEPPVQWRFDIFNSSIVLADAYGNVGDTVDIYVITDGEYSINGTTLILNNAPADGESVEIFKYSNHNIVGMERINYDVVSRVAVLTSDVEQVTFQRLTVGEITLRNPAVDVQYVWVSVNGELLSPSVDYYLTDNKTKVRLVRQPHADDTIDIIHFSKYSSTPRFAYRQFKDILNRTHFKRLDSPATVLAAPLLETDLRIELQNANSLPEPNRGARQPGVIFIDGERIEYFMKEGNTLRLLRRGTLGTGTKARYDIGTDVYDQSAKKTVPYKDVTQVQKIIAPGNISTFELNFKAQSVDEFEIFVAGKRLRKTAISVFDPSIALDSPKGDVVTPAEFTVSTDIDEVTGKILTSYVNLLEAPLEGQHIVITRKMGKTWTENGVPLAETQTDIGFFLRAGTTKLPE